MGSGVAHAVAAGFGAAKAPLEGAYLRQIAADSKMSLSLAVLCLPQLVFVVWSAQLLFRQGLAWQKQALALSTLSLKALAWWMSGGRGQLQRAVAIYAAHTLYMVALLLDDGSLWALFYPAYLRWPGLGSAIYACGMLPLGTGLPAYQQVPLSVGYELLQYLMLLVLQQRHGHNINAHLRLVLRVSVASVVAAVSDFSRRRRFLAAAQQRSVDEGSKQGKVLEGALELVLPLTRKPPQYQPVLSRQRSCVKVPDLHLRDFQDQYGEQRVEELKRAMLARLQERYPHIHIHQISVREGCVIMQVDLLALAAGPGAQQAGPADLASWVQLLPVQELLGSSSAFHVAVGGLRGQFEYDAETRCLAAIAGSTEAGGLGTCAPLSHLQPRCVALEPKDDVVPPQGSTMCGSTVFLEAWVHDAFVAGNGSGHLEGVMGGQAVSVKLLPTLGASDASGGRRATIQVELPASQTGLLSINAWSGPHLMASEEALILPAGCSGAAAEVAGIADAGSAEGIRCDLACVLEGFRTSLAEGQDPAHLGLLVTAADQLLQWARQAQLPATVQLLEELSVLKAGRIRSGGDQARAETGASGNGHEDGEGGGSPCDRPRAMEEHPRRAAPAIRVPMVWVMIKVIQAVAYSCCSPRDMPVLLLLHWPYFVLTALTLARARRSRQRHASDAAPKSVGAAMKLLLMSAAMADTEPQGAAETQTFAHNGPAGPSALESNEQYGSRCGMARIQGALHWLLELNVGLALHLNTFLVIFLASFGAIQMPGLACKQVLRLWLVMLQTVLGNTLMAYDLRVAPAFISLVHIPAMYCLFRHQSVPQPLGYSLLTGVVALAAQGAAAFCRARASCARAADAGAGKCLKVE